MSNTYTKGWMAAAFTLLLAGSSYAAPVGTPVKIKAVATITDPGTVSLNSVAVKRLSDDAAATDVTWTVATLGNWQIANHYLSLNAVTSKTGSGIQIYTDNLNSTDPAFQSTLTAAERQTTSPGGLVNTANKKQSIPVAWAIKSSKDNTFTAADPNGATAIPAVPNAFAWHYVVDKGNLNNPATPGVDEGFQDAADYQTMQSPAGIHFGQRNFDYGPASNPKVVYLEANFGAAAGGATYGTTTLTVEAFQQ